MEAAKTIGPPPPPISSPEQGNARLHILPSPPEKGVFYPDYALPSYESAVDSENIKQLKEPEHHEGYGTVHIEEWPMLDGSDTRYEIARCLADNPVSDAWVVKDTAWSTQVEGANMDIARELMGLGFNVLIKGPEIGSSIPLSQSAYHTHLILDTLQERHDDVDTSVILVEGYSRGSMIGFGTNAYAPRFNRMVIYSNLTDACVGRPITFDLETVKKAVTLPGDLGLLGADVALSLMDIRRIGNLRKTIDPTPKGFVQFVRTGAPLMTGEAGMMAARVPDDMHATVAFFRRCRVNDAGLYKAILADRPGVRFVYPEGGHGSGLERRIMNNIAVRFGRVATQLAEGRGPTEIDYQQIIYGQKAA